MEELVRFLEVNLVSRLFSKIQTVESTFVIC